MSSALPPRVIIDNGSGFVKVGWSGQVKPKVVMPNCAAQVKRKQQHVGPTLIGDLCYQQPEYFCHRPFYNGLLVDPDIMRDVWDRALGKGYLNCSPKDYSVCITEPFLTPSVIKHTTAEILIEDFGFRHILISAAPSLAPYGFWGLHWGQFDILQNLEGSLPRVTCYKGDDSDSLLGIGRPQPGGPGPSKFRKGPSDNSKIHNSRTNSPPPPLPLPNALKEEHDPNKFSQFYGIKYSESFPNDLYCTKDPNYIDPSPYISRESDKSLSARNPCSLVVDCGFSGCHAAPFFEYIPLEKATLRINLGGQHLNSYLKNLVAFRHINLEYNELLVQHMKEECCFVSPNYKAQMGYAYQEMKKSQALRSLRLTHLNREYTLPDYNTKNKSFLIDFFYEHRSYNENTTEEVAPTDKSETSKLIQQDDFSLLNNERRSVVLNNERIAVPEVLFSPSDVYSQECSLPELISRSIASAPIELQPLLSRQILLVGGTSKLPGLRERLWVELRSRLPQKFPICIYQHDDPQNSVWVGASQYAHDDNLFSIYSISREKFLENGYSNDRTLSES